MYIYYTHTHTHIYIYIYIYIYGYIIYFWKIIIFSCSRLLVMVFSELATEDGLSDRKIRNILLELIKL